MTDTDEQELVDSLQDNESSESDDEFIIPEETHAVEAAPSLADSGDLWQQIYCQQTTIEDPNLPPSPMLSSLQFTEKLPQGAVDGLLSPKQLLSPHRQSMPNAASIVPNVQKEELAKTESPRAADTETKNETPTEATEANPAAPSTPVQSGLRSKLRETFQTNKGKFVSINLDSLSALAVADIKRFSLSTTAIVDIDVCKARNLPPTKSGPVSPTVLLAIRRDTSKDHEKKIDIKKQFETTSVIPKNSNPIWNEHKELNLDQVAHRWLVVEIRDKGPKGEIVGFVELNMSNIADMVQREEWFPLKKRKKEKPAGEILLRTRIRPERKVSEAIVIRNENFPTIPQFIYSSFWNSHCVKQVAITHSQLTSIPDGFFSLASLEVLQLHHNNITTVPKTLGRIFGLKLLDLSYNRISTLPTELSNLKNLQEFNITENKFDENEVPPPIVDLDLWCDVIGKPAKWDQLIEEELARRQESGQLASSADAALLDEKEKEIQRLLESMNNKA